VRAAFEALFSEDAFADIEPHLAVGGCSAGLTTFDPAVWLMVRGHMDTKFEPCGQAALRHCVVGCRQVAIIAYTDVLALLKKSLVKGGSLMCVR
jgi:hypothetical protein